MLQPPNPLHLTAHTHSSLTFRGALGKYTVFFAALPKTIGIISIHTLPPATAVPAAAMFYAAAEKKEASAPTTQSV